MLDAQAAVIGAQVPVASIAHSYTGTTIAGGKSVVLTSAVTNSMGSSYQWKQVSGTPVNLEGSSTATAKFTTPATRTNLVFELSVTTALGTSLSAKDTVSVNNPPVLITTEFNEFIGDAAVFNLKATDADGDQLTYILTRATYPGTKLEGSTLYWPIGGGTGNFELEIVDPLGLSVSAKVAVFITNPPAAGGSTTITDSGGKGGGAITPGQLAVFSLLIAGLFLGKREEVNTEE